ncbi:MAG: hypothetical protein ONB44_13605 [candidate division KSB1 bacterium]|nr:hypothetical protein [candidate division KSB1 bacterium]MDZ7303159.1 hypothetical protein [candidate division KSB1 bacterium]
MFDIHDLAGQLCRIFVEFAGGVAQTKNFPARAMQGMFARNANACPRTKESALKMILR